jgi:hypothetical protein
MSELDQLLQGYFKQQRTPSQQEAFDQAHSHVVVDHATMPIEDW